VGKVARQPDGGASDTSVGVRAVNIDSSVGM
jgi:hypothetical protein